jgi:hypothetical protein
MKPNLSTFYIYYILFRFSNQNKGRRKKPVDVSLQIKKLSEGHSER